ncbi:MAG TPA: Fic family protein [Hymenobacter sp.]|jgi:fido (protein-threonine AMPylation protein)|uniref:Fic/DOC family protein n=1 Tax=Hymenobacter sp. TaxID=1898978 RepID=UPI002ED96597
MADLFANPADGLLYNNVRATSEVQLDRLEADLSIKRLMLVRAQVGLAAPRPSSEPIVGPAYPIPLTPLRFDEQYLRAMHRYLFQDVYPWAGETRQDRAFQGYKPAPNVQADHLMTYANHRRISPDVEALAVQLAAENNLKGLTKPQFVERAAYYLDHFNHVHPFREGNGRTMQAVLMQLGHQAGYRISFEKVYKDFNLARDTGVVGVSANQQENQTRLRYLLDTATTPLPGAAGLLARLPNQAQPLAASTLEVARIEALRELKASSQRVGIRHAEETGASLKAPNGAVLTSPVMNYVQAAIMARPEALTEQATLDELKSAYIVIARSAKPQFTDKAVLQRFTQATQQAVKLHQQRVAVRQEVLLTEPKGVILPPVTATSTKQKAPGPKRRGPKL